MQTVVPLTLETSPYHDLPHPRRAADGLLQQGQTQRPVLHLAGAGDGRAEGDLARSYGATEVGKG